jgi:hypothetical protein
MITDIVVKEAGSNGPGVFARRDISKGEFIFRRRKARLIPNDEVESLTPSNGKCLYPVDQTLSAILHPPGCYLRHSCDPSAITRGVNVFARKDIREGDEITIDYRLGVVSGERLECSCGSCQDGSGLQTEEDVQDLSAENNNLKGPQEAVPAASRKAKAAARRGIRPRDGASAPRPEPVSPAGAENKSGYDSQLDGTPLMEELAGGVDARAEYTDVNSAQPAAGPLISNRDSSSARTLLFRNWPVMSAMVIRVGRAAGRQVSRDEKAGVFLGKTTARLGISLWGQMPALALSSAAGLLLLAAANWAGWNELPWGETVFWIGLLTIYLPIIARLVTPTVGRRETISLVILLGLALYMVKLLHSPLTFTQHDEFFHWRTANDILQNERLFLENPLLPVSALYPALETITVSLASVGGLTIFQAGVLIVAITRILLVLGLFFLFERVTRSHHAAGIGAAVYMANPNFLFFLSMFKYQSLALAMAAVVLFLLVRNESRQSYPAQLFPLAVVIMMFVIAASHHITSYAVVAFLLLWTAISFLLRRKGIHVHNGWAAVVMIAISVFWLIFVASSTISYLSPHFIGAFQELIRLLAGDPEAGRTLFRSSIEVTSSGTVVRHGTPLWERLVGFGGMGLVLAAIPLGLFVIWKRYGSSAMAISLGLSALGYPATQVLRLTNRGWEIGNRSSEFLFLGVGFVIALAVLELQQRIRRRPVLRNLTISLGLTLIFLSGIVIGLKPDWRLPGPYMPESATRSIEAQGLSGAEWVRDTLQPGNRFGADKINMLLMGSYGEQHMSKTLSGGVDVYWILYAPEINERQIESINRGRVEYIIVDQRVFSPSRIRGFYRDVTPEQALQKFEREELFSRIYDSGDIVIYNVEGVLNHVE